ncbi:MAG: glutamate racemase [Bauldia sp.]|nr:glutamate racemase [Bauldia sp.]
MQPDDVAPTAPLLFFDSGIGGLSVLAEVRRRIPTAPIVYLCDRAFFPYGDRTEIEIAARVPALLGRAVERFRPRLVVIACNTASTIALAVVRTALQLPIVGTVPAIKPAAETTKTGVIGLLGTQATVRQHYVDRLAADHAAGMTLLRHGDPALAPAVEAKLRGEAVDPAVWRQAMRGLLEQPGGDRMDVVVLGCTHFPLVRDELAAEAPGVAFVDGAAGIARRIERLTAGQPWPDRPSAGHFVSTADPADSARYAAAISGYGLTIFNRL